MYKYFPSPWALLLTVASGVRTVTMGGMLAECRETTCTAQEFRHLHPLPWKKGLCPPGGGQKTSLYPLRVYYTVTTGTISSLLPHILPRILGPRAKLVRGFSSPISQLLLLPIKVYLAWQAHTQQDYTWFSIPGVRRTGAYKQHPGSCMAANSLFLLSAPRRLAEICHPQIWHFSILITVNTMGSEKQQMQGDTFSDLLQDRLSKRSSGVIYPSPFPGVFIKQGGCWLSPQERLELTPWSDFVTSSHASWASQVALVVKNLPANTRAIRDKGLREDPLEEGLTATPVHLPGEFHGQSSLAGYGPQGHKESDTTEVAERLRQQQHPFRLLWSLERTSPSFLKVMSSPSEVYMPLLFP